MNYHEETIKILSDIDINGRTACKVMGISHSLFGNKFGDKYRNKFSEDNYRELSNWLIYYAAKIPPLQNTP